MSYCGIHERQRGALVGTSACPECRRMVKEAAQLTPPGSLEEKRSAAGKRGYKAKAARELVLTHPEPRKRVAARRTPAAPLSVVAMLAPAIAKLKEAP